VSLYCFPYPYFFGFLLMDESQTIRKSFVCCLSTLRVSRRIAEFHDGSRTLRVIFCHPHCELCLNLWATFVAKVVFDSSLSFLGIFSGNGGEGVGWGGWSDDGSFLGISIFELRCSDCNVRVKKFLECVFFDVLLGFFCLAFICLLPVNPSAHLEDLRHSNSISAVAWCSCLFSKASTIWLASVHCGLAKPDKHREPFLCFLFCSLS
jgi:hypothetical protein